MQKLLAECQRIYSVRYLEDGDTMIATTSVLQALQRDLSVVRIQDSRVDYKFVVYKQHALFTKSVTYKTRQSKRDEFDVDHICTEIGNATRAIRKFFRQKQFKNYSVGVNIGNSRHDMAVFIKKECNSYDLVHFDPNEKSASKAMTNFQKSLAKNSTRRGYHPKNGNKNGKCSFLAWNEILQFLLLEKNPFKLRNLLIYDKQDNTYYTEKEIGEIKTIRKRNRANLNLKTKINSLE